MKNFELELLKKMASEYMIEKFVEDCRKDSRLLGCLNKFIFDLPELVDRAVNAMLEDESSTAAENIAKEIAKVTNTKCEVGSGNIPNTLKQFRRITISKILMGDPVHVVEVGDAILFCKNGEEDPADANADEYIAGIAAAIMQAVEQFSPMPINGRVQFQLNGRTVRFGGDIDAQTAVDLAHDLAGATRGGDK